MNEFVMLLGADESDALGSHMRFVLQDVNLAGGRKVLPREVHGSPDFVRIHHLAMHALVDEGFLEPTKAEEYIITEKGRECLYRLGR